MISISKTPLRLSFFSGGSDMPEFYSKGRGAALSVTIDKYIYVYVHRRQYNGLKTVFDSIEEVHGLDYMQHDITRECLSYFNIDNNVTVGSVSDINCRGSGLGSSSSYTVGLINALSVDYDISLNKTAELAFNIEANMCGYPVGKQDQYAASYGGFNHFTFNNTGIVDVLPLTSNCWKLQDKLLLVYSGRGRSANKILQKQKDAISNTEKYKLIEKGCEKAYTGMNLLSREKFDDFGNLLHMAWLDKKEVVKEITNDYFDNIYDKAMKAGAYGGKLLGAGGGGFFIFYVPDNAKYEVIESITKDTDCKVFDFQFTYSGSKKILFS